MLDAITLGMMLADDKFVKGLTVVAKLDKVMDDDFGAKVARCSEEELDKLMPHIKAIEEILKGK